MLAVSTEKNNSDGLCKILTVFKKERTQTHTYGLLSCSVDFSPPIRW